LYFSNFGSLKSTETLLNFLSTTFSEIFQQFRLVEEH